MAGQISGAQPLGAEAQGVAGVATAVVLARLLRQLRRRQARQRGETTLTYRELAAKTGWSRGIIGEYFSGNVLPPTDRFDVLIQLLGATPAERGWLATARDRVEEYRHSQPLANSGTASGRFLPPAPTRPHGWDAEAQAAADLLISSKSRLVTLTGPEGVGKTTLALAVATLLMSYYLDGVAFVSLLSVRDPGLLMPTIAEALGLRKLGARPSVEVVHGYLRTRRVLLVLDNAEDLLPAAPRLAALLAAAPGLGMLVSSRSPLGLQGEQIYPVVGQAARAAAGLLAQRADELGTGSGQRVVSALVAGGGLLLEREGVLAAIAGLVEGVRAGRGGALFVVGEAGLGKTTCLAQAGVLASPVVRVGLGCGDVMEASLPFSVFTSALGAVGYRDLLRAPSGGAGFGDIRVARFYGVLHWLEQVTDPVLLVLDDLHWADSDSLALLSFVCRRLAGLPVAVLGALRPWPSAAQELTGALVYDGHASMQRLAPLSEEAAAALLTARSDGPVGEAESRAMAELCAGNPLLLEQVAASIDGQGWTGGRIGVGSAVGAEEIVLTRFAGLPAAALRAARAASVLGTRFRPALAVKVAELDERQAGAALEALCGSGLVRAATAMSAEFVHPLLCQSLYHDMAAPVRARLHTRAFTVLCDHGLDAEAVEHAIQADLIGDPAAIMVVERAGRAALAVGALGTAAEHLRAAVRLAGSRASSALLLSLGDVLVVGGRPAEAIEVYERVCAQVDLDPVDRVRSLRMLSRALFVTAAHDQASQRFGEAAAVAEACGQTAVADVLVGDAVFFLFTLGPAHSLPVAARACELTRTGCGALRRQATAAWGLVALLSGDPAGLVACETAAGELITELVDPPEVRWGHGPWGAFALAALFTERFADAAHALDVVLATADRVGATEARVTHLIIKAVLALRQGRLGDALTGVDQASPLAELMPYRQGSTGFVTAEVLLLRGRLAECADWCQRTEALAAAHGQSYVLLRLWHVRAQLLHHAGDHTGACGLYERIEQLTVRLGIAEPCAVPWARHAVLAYLADDRLDDAQRVLDWLERAAAGLPCRWPRIAAATGQAVLAEARGDLEAADRHYQAALVSHQQVELPVEYIETLLGYGAFLRRRGQPTQGRPRLAQALEIAEKCGATWLADQAHEELTIAGGRRRRACENPTRLTAQEQRVARLTAAGQSNKTIAGQLFLSTKTIEYHLAQVYTKLGITSRRQLITGHYDLGPARSPESCGQGPDRARSDA